MPAEASAAIFGAMTRTSAARRTLATLGAELERDRLQGRAHRLERVVAALHARARDHAVRSGRVPRPLAASLQDFQRELTDVRRLLSEGEPADTPRAI